MKKIIACMVALIACGFVAMHEDLIKIESQSGDIAHINDEDVVNHAYLYMIDDDVVVLYVPHGKIDLNVKELRRALNKLSYMPVPYNPDNAWHGEEGMYELD